MLSAFVIGVVGGCAFAALTSSIDWADTLLRPALTALRATPVASFIILALVWMSSGTVPVFAASIMAMPIVWANVTQGIASVNRELLEVAYVYEFGKLRTIWNIILPSISGTFIAACGTSIGLCWKAMIAAEVLGTPSGAIGTQLYNSKIYLETDALFAWTLVVILLSNLLERAFAILSARLGKNR
jgi:NitT/TauT family transport system permease protein